MEVTSRAGEAHHFALEAAAKGSKIVVAWGGDGTINEVASALVRSNTALGVIPSGSGNGFARTFAIPSDPEQAIMAALDGPVRHVDAGVLEDRYFFNVAGVGLDAIVARDFNRAHAAHRGLVGYVRTVLSTVLQYQPASYSIDWGGPAFTGRAFMVVLANGREYGNGFVVAPDADPSDGLLDVAIVTATSRARDLWRAFTFATRRSLMDDHIVTGRCGQLTIVSERPMWAHVDGESFEAGKALHVRAHPAVLLLRCP